MFAVLSDIRGSLCKQSIASYGRRKPRSTWAFPQALSKSSGSLESAPHIKRRVQRLLFITPRNWIGGLTATAAFPRLTWAKRMGADESWTGKARARRLLQEPTGRKIRKALAAPSIPNLAPRLTARKTAMCQLHLR